jgi:hypothetical protein
MAAMRFGDWARAGCDIIWVVNEADEKWPACTKPAARAAVADEIVGDIVPKPWRRSLPSPGSRPLQGRPPDPVTATHPRDRRTRQEPMENIMKTTTRIAAAALLAFGFASAASAEEWTGPRFTGSGEDLTATYPTPSQNVVGGATYRFTGSGENVNAEPVQVRTAQPGRVHRQVGSGEGAQTVYVSPRG